MSEDLIKRSDAIKAIDELPNAYNGWSDTYDKAYIIGTLEEVPSADRPQGEWTSVLAELHERFDALEKELRKASAEMSAIVREHIDGQEDESQTSCDTCKHKGEYAYCRLCGRLSENNYEPLTNCGADMREREGE